MLDRNIFHKKIPWHRSPFDERLIHRKHVGVDLRLVSDERTRSMKNSGIDLPTCARLQFIRARQIQNFVIAFIPPLQASPDIVFRGPGIQTHKSEWKVVPLEVILRREIVGFRLSFLANARGKFIVLMKVMGYRTQVVEELA